MSQFDIIIWYLLTKVVTPSTDPLLFMGLIKILDHYTYGICPLKW